MQTAYLLLSGVSCLYFVRREFDLFTICFYSSVIYFAPALVGYTCYDWRTTDIYPISTAAYTFYIFYISTLVTFAMIFERTSRFSVQTHTTGISNAVLARSHSTLLECYRGAFLVTIALLIITLVSGNSRLFVSSKQDLLDDAPVTLPFLQAASICFGSLALMTGRRSGLAIALGLCAFDLALGFRGVTAFTLLIGLTWLGYKWRGIARGRKLQLVLPLIFIVLYLGSSVVSGISAGIRRTLLGMPSGDIGTADWLVLQLQYTEAFSQQAVFDRVINSDIVMPWSYLLDLIRIFIPKVHELFGSPIDFNAVFQPQLFPEIPWGMASNIWAEQFCIGGELLLVGFTVFVFVSVGITNRYVLVLLSKNQYLGPALLTILAVPAILFMHRNGLVYQLKLLRDSALIFGCCFTLGNLLKAFSSTRGERYQKVIYRRRRTSDSDIKI